MAELPLAQHLQQAEVTLTSLLLRLLRLQVNGASPNCCAFKTPSSIAIRHHRGNTRQKAGRCARERAAHSRRNSREHPRRRPSCFYLVANIYGCSARNRSSQCPRRSPNNVPIEICRGRHGPPVLLTGSLVASFLISRANASGLLYLSGLTCLSCNAGVGETVHNAKETPTRTIPRPRRRTQH
jgi:hypothetical protein